MRPRGYPHPGPHPVPRSCSDLPDQDGRNSAAPLHAGSNDFPRAPATSANMRMQREREREREREKEKEREMTLATTATNSLLFSLQLVFVFVFCCAKACVINERKNDAKEKREDTNAAHEDA